MVYTLSVKKNCLPQLDIGFLLHGKNRLICFLGNKCAHNKLKYTLSLYFHCLSKFLFKDVSISFGPCQQVVVVCFCLPFNMWRCSIC